MSRFLGWEASWLGRSQGIANGVLFLASDASSYMTGAELVIDGGIGAVQYLGGAEFDSLKVSFNSIRKVRV